MGEHGPQWAGKVNPDFHIRSFPEQISAKPRTDKGILMGAHGMARKSSDKSDAYAQALHGRNALQPSDAEGLLNRKLLPK